MFKILFFFLCCCIPLSQVSALSFSGKPCQYNGNVQSSLDGCLAGSTLVDSSGPTLLEGNVKVQIVNWTNALAAFLGLIAVGAIVYGGLLMTLSQGEEEQIKKGKDVVKWAILGFLTLIVSGGIVRLVIELIFSFSD